MKRFTIVLPLLVLGVLVGCQSDDGNHLDRYQGEKVSSLLKKGDLALRDSRYEKASEYYEAVTTYAPLSTENRLAVLHNIYSHYLQGDVDGTQALVDHFIRFYPQDKRVPYAMYVKAMVVLDQRGSWLQKKVHIAPDRFDVYHLQQAYALLHTLQARYPNSVYGKQALYVLWELKYWLAHHELITADFYMSRGAYLSAANRALNALSIDQRHVIVAPALERLATIYTKLGDQVFLKQVKQAQRRLAK